MRLTRRDELLPQVSVEDGSLVAVSPTVTRPPLGDSADHLTNEVRRIGVQRNIAVALERPNRGDRRHQLHTGVRREAVTTRQLLPMTAVKQHDAVAAGSRVAEARAVREDRDLLSSLVHTL